MQRETKAFCDTIFDVVIVGGGITGACLAHDATQRGLSVALVDRHDFGSATSAASSKLLHGGIRYLQQVRPGKVRESAYERACFNRIAPHLTRWVPFLIPTHTGLMKGRLFLQCGMALYEILTKQENRNLQDPEKLLPASTYYSRGELIHRVPLLNGRDEVTGAGLIYESHVHSTERLTLAFLKTAVLGGAVVANYVKAGGVKRYAGHVQAVSVVDQLTGDQFDIQGRFIVNAAGPWIAELNRQFGVGELKVPVSGFSKGVHVVTRQLVDTYALALPTRRRSSAVFDRGGRHVFVIPWRGHSLIGTSDRPYDGDLDGVRPSDDDIVDLLTDLNESLPGVELNRRDVVHAFAGLYPLTVRDVKPDVYQGTGDYQVIDHGQGGGADGVISVLGAKYTTARKVAERAVNLICQRLGWSKVACRTGVLPLAGGDIDNLTSFTKDTVNRYRDKLSLETVKHLVQHYGTETDAVIASSTTLEDKLLARVSPDRESIGAEVRFAVTDEMAVTLADTVFRRTGLGTVGDPGEACLRRCAEIMATPLGWSETRVDEELQRTKSLFIKRDSTIS